MFTLLEPQWGIDLLVSLNAWMMASPTLVYWIPKLADIFVFVYPVFLLVMYFWRMENGKRIRDNAKNMYYKIAALWIGFSVLATVMVNVLIQYVFAKVRPNVILGLIDNKTKSILHEFLPSSSFPSDHAAVSMSIAVATLVWGLMKNPAKDGTRDRSFIWMSIPLFAFSLIMCFCRIAGGIHWPTDIIAGMIVGVVVPLLGRGSRIADRVVKVLEWIAKKV